MKYSYKTQNVCARQINFDLEDGVVKNIEFIGGCPGNALALSKVLEGQKAEFIIERLKNNPCGRRPTSCADQLALAVEKALQNNNKNTIP